MIIFIWFLLLSFDSIVKDTCIYEHEGSTLSWWFLCLVLVSDLCRFLKMRKYSFLMCFERIFIDWIIYPFDAPMRQHNFGVFFVKRFLGINSVCKIERDVCKCSVSFCVKFVICIFQRYFPFHLRCQLYWCPNAQNFP